MEFTGERYIPELHDPEISYEHWHRYLYATQFAKDKVVLDIACGEGYGSHLLSSLAKRVVGVDISEEAVKHARSKYIRDNLSFLVGNMNKIPITENKMFDLVVCFETIEHVEEKVQHDFLQEIKRLLKPEGILIISTPDKLFYSDIPKYKNEFHIREFYHDEFKKLLAEYFKNVIILGQKIEVGSYIAPFNDVCTNFREFRIKHTSTGFAPTEEASGHLYLIALCSDSKLPGLVASICLDLSQRLITKRIEQVQQLQAQLAEREQVIQRLLNSKSWRLTAPLRQIYALGRQLLHKDDLYLIRRSHFFNAQWYLQQNPDVAQAGIDPACHYLHQGWREGRDPSLLFSTRWYLDTYEDVRQAGINPLVHYLRYGRKEKRLPKPPETSSKEKPKCSAL